MNSAKGDPTKPVRRQRLRPSLARRWMSAEGNIWRGWRSAKMPARPDPQPLVRRITMPVAAPKNNKRHTVDWTKKPGSRFSTASL